MGIRYGDYDADWNILVVNINLSTLKMAQV